MATHGIVRTDELSGTWRGTDLVHFIYLPNDVAADIDNGNVVLLGKRVSGDRDTYDAETPARNSALKDIALVANPEIMEDERLNRLSDYYNKAGRRTRGYRVNDKGFFSVTAACVTPIEGTAPAEDQVVELQASTKLKLTSSLTSGSTQVGTVWAIEGDWIVIQLV